MKLCRSTVPLERIFGSMYPSYEEDFIPQLKLDYNVQKKTKKAKNETDNEKSVQTKLAIV